MKNSVIIKGNRYGISVVLNSDLEFSTLLQDLAAKLKVAEEFFNSDAPLAVTFEGRVLSNEELDQLLFVIQNNSKLNIQYVMDKNSELEATFFDIIQSAQGQEEAQGGPAEQRAPAAEEQAPEAAETFSVTEDNEDRPPVQPVVRQNLPASADSSGMFYKGTLRSGQTLESQESLIIIGDVNPGATVIAGGNIIIIGALKGSVAAGSDGNRNAFVMALSMDPIQIQIADIIARRADKNTREKSPKETMIATVINEQICIESVSKAAIQDIQF